MGTEMLTAIQTAVSSIQTDVTSVLGAVGPVAIAIVGLYLVWRLGIKFFKGLVGR